MAVDVVKRCAVNAKFDLARHDPDETFGWDKDWAKARSSELLVKVADLQERLFAEGEQALLMVLQAMLVLH